MSQSEITGDKNSLNWFKSVYTQLLDVTDSQNDTLCKINLK